MIETVCLATQKCSRSFQQALCRGRNIILIYVEYLGRNQFAMAMHEPVSVQDHSNKHYVF